MKILLAGTIAGQGGIQSHLRWLAQALSEEGIEVMIISLQPINPLDDCYYPLKEANIKLFSPTQNNTFLKIKEVIQVAREFNPDVYIGVGTGWLISLLGKLLPQSTKTIFHEVMSGVPSGWKDSRWGVKWWFDDVIAQSPTVAKTFKQCFGWKKSITALPAFPEPLEMTATIPKVEAKPVTMGTAKAALFSRLVPHKQAFWLVQQWDALKEVLGELHIHGSGAEEFLIRDYIESNHIGNRVKCFGRYPEGQAYVNLLSSYDLTLLPTIGAEGAPLVLLESMACGVPFVAYGVGGIPDYGNNNPDVMIVPLDDSFAHAVKEQTINSSQKNNQFVLTVKEMAKKLSQGQVNQPRLQQFYLDNYSYESLKKLWISYLKS